MKPELIKAGRTYRGLAFDWGGISFREVISISDHPSMTSPLVRWQRPGETGTFSDPLSAFAEWAEKDVTEEKGRRSMSKPGSGVEVISTNPRRLRVNGEVYVPMDEVERLDAQFKKLLKSHDEFRRLYHEEIHRTARLSLKRERHREEAEEQRQLHKTWKDMARKHNADHARVLEKWGDLIVVVQEAIQGIRESTTYSTQDMRRVADKLEAELKRGDDDTLEKPKATCSKCGGDDDQATDDDQLQDIKKAISQLEKRVKRLDGVDAENHIVIWEHIDELERQQKRCQDKTDHLGKETVLLMKTVEAFKKVLTERPDGWGK